MKNSDMKVIAIILAIALFFTVITSNAVSIASVVFLAKNDTAAAPVGDGAATPDAGTTGGSTATTPSGSTGGSTATTPSGTTGGSTATTPSGSTGGSTATTPSGSTGGSTATPDAGSTGGSTATPDAGQAQMSKTEICDLYRNAAKTVRAGKAGFSRKTFQAIKSIDLGAASALVEPIIKKFMKTEDQAEVKVYPANEAKDKMPVSTFTDADVKKATVTTKGDNYVVTIVMNAEQSPAKDGTTGVAAMAGYEILYMEDVKKEITNLGLDVKNESMNYVAYTTVAEITKDGKFVSITQECDGELAATVKVLLDVNAKGVLTFHANYMDFKY